MTPSTTDILWILVSAGLVFLMQAGFLCLESGLTRSKNNINVAIKNLTDLGISIILFWTVGFGLMFGPSWQGWLGAANFLPDFSQISPYQTAFFLFQAMFCGTAVTILSGAVAERMHFRGYIVLAILVSGLIYPFFGHWAWNGVDVDQPLGWLAQQGFVDFAGSSVVHSVGGWAALAALLVLGPRIGRFPTNGPPHHISGSNLPVATLGVILLWLGWFGFNGGSTLAMDAHVPVIIANTALASGSGLLTALAISWALKKQADVLFVMNGTLAGLVAITANVHAVSAQSAVLIGAIGAIVMISITILLERLKIDDAVGAVPVHLGAGIWGTLAVAFFGRPELLATGLTFGQQLQAQLLGVVTCCTWAFGVTLLLLLPIKMMMSLRVTPKEEQVGLNVSEHGATTELLQLFNVLEKQSQTGDLSLRVPVEPFTEVGQIAERYNLVMEALEQAINKTEAVVQTAMDGIVTFSRESLMISTLNPAAEIMFGYRQNYLVNRPISLLFADLTSSPLSANGKEALHMVIREFAGVGLHEVRGRRADGSTFPMEVVVGQATASDEPFYIATVRDITERNRAREALEEARDAAEAANRAKSIFLANMSHELRTPLNAIIGYSEMLQEELEDVDQQEFIPDLERIRTAGRHLLTLINDILDLSKIEAGKMELYLEEINIALMAQNVVETIQPLVNKNGNKLIVVHDDNIGRLYADLVKVRQALFNLLSNACKFTENGQITLAIERYRPADTAEEWLTFTVADTGIGMKPEQVEQVFLEFTQADASTTRKYGGTGLGLSISRRFCQLMGGDITVESEYQHGSTFTITLPAHVTKPEIGQLPAENRPPSQPQPVLSHDAQNSVLVIDDDPVVRDLMRRFLSREGFAVVTAATGQEGLKRARELKPIAITLDVMMPGIDGWSVLTDLKRDPALADIPVIMLTMVDNRNMGYALGAADYLTKPIDRQQMVSLLRKYRCRSPACQVLVVEDDASTREMMRRVLEREGWAVEEAENGRVALDCVSRSKPELILLDLMMPQVDGFQFLRELRSNPAWRSLPVVVVTAMDLTSEQVEQLRGNVERILQKGAYNRDSLLEEVREMVAACIDKGE